MQLCLFEAMKHFSLIHLESYMLEHFLCQQLGVATAAYCCHGKVDRFEEENKNKSASLSFFLVMYRLNKQDITC